jgi:DnaJ-class molecular chaperone
MAGATCPYCEGTGKVKELVITYATEETRVQWVTCPKCHGRGEVRC